jgi:hypothetical protein
LLLSATSYNEPGVKPAEIKLRGLKGKSR